MKKISTGLAILMVALLVACSSADKGEAKAGGGDDTHTAQASAAANIDWTRFDDALTAAAAEDKHVIAYFWRDG